LVTTRTRLGNTSVVCRLHPRGHDAIGDDPFTSRSRHDNTPARRLKEPLATRPIRKNDGDNEITGEHVSNGDPGHGGILGAQNPRLGDGRWRWFYTDPTATTVEGTDTLPTR
jgi:hypothetical protein